MSAEWYSDAALEKQAAIERLRAEGRTVPLALFCGMCEPRVQPTDAERCRCCQSDAREGVGGDGRYCGLCLGRGHGEGRLVTDTLPLLLPTVPGKVHGIVGLDPITVQCDGCAKRVDHRTLGLSSDHHNLTILTCGITFNPRLSGIDDRRLCRECAKDAGWVR